MAFLEYVLAGLGVGVVFGMFGAGGSAFATPVLALIGVPPLFAVASPLPAMLPAAVTGARRFVKAGNLDRRVAKLAIIGGVPGTLFGALASTAVGGDRLLVLSGLMLLVIGIRLLMRDSEGAAERASARRDRNGMVLASAFGVGILTGLLANGGGFLLVPVFVLVLGLTAIEAAGTSMVVVGILTIPTLITHWALGHVDWVVAGGFALGLIPAAAIGARIAQRLPAARARFAFALMLIVFATWFLIRQVT
ncbi:MAG: sulfite exporter TauE/SafE family protein [Acidimicrobiia bacterium]|nr:sulfite exporter TauE/SafE family protein [Acidimicrobiia bacterium]